VTSILGFCPPIPVFAKGLVAEINRP